MPAAPVQFVLIAIALRRIPRCFLALLIADARHSHPHACLCQCLSPCCFPSHLQEVLARVETQLRLFMGEVQQLQEAAERSAALLGQILPNHILDSLKAGSRVLVEKFSDVCVIYAGAQGCVVVHIGGMLGGEAGDAWQLQSANSGS